MVGEVVVLAMFEDKDAAFVEQVAVEYELWNLGQLFECIGWVGKDEVELLMAALHESEYIATNQNVALFVQLLEALADEVGMVSVGLDAYHPATAS